MRTAPCDILHPVSTASAPRFIPLRERPAAGWRGACLVLAAVAGLGLPTIVSAAGPRALEEGALPADRRLGALRTLNDYFPFKTVETPAEWEARAEELRRRVLVATGLLIPPTATPLEAIVHGRVERDDYSVERVILQSFPGHYVTGSLYRPKAPAKAENGKYPAVLTPHGHWPDGRFHDHGEAGVKTEIDVGGERSPEGGRHPLQARCAQLARMGCIVFHYDMVGYADSIQLDHRPGVREAMNTPEEWGLFSPQAELRGQHLLALQTWNSVRALDFLVSLEDVDPHRVGVTGASGGGTQTFVLGAVDDRPAALFPAVMVSTAMQGGCPCENAPFLRIDAGNIDIAALAAPRPLGMTAADDWTKEIESKGGPDLIRLYGMLDIPDKLGIYPFLQFGHNYNIVSREAMYGWMNRALDLGLDEPIRERDYQPLTRAELTVWNDEHPAPAGEQVGEAHERALAGWWARDIDGQLDALGLEHPLVRAAWRVLIGRTLSEAGPVRWDLRDKVERDGHLVMSGTLTADDHGEQVPALFAYPGGEWNGEVVIRASLSGKNRAMLTDAGALQEWAAGLVAKGTAVMAVDLLGTGEFVRDGEEPWQRQRLAVYGNGSDAWQQFAGYTFGYNLPLFSQRAHDLLTAIAFIRGNEDWETKKIHLLADEDAGPIALAAAAMSGRALTRVAAATGGFRFASLTRFDDAAFVPSSVRYGDLPALIASTRPVDGVLIAGEPGSGVQLEGEAWITVAANWLAP